ncbi:hypothetical protein K435DRAFT_962909 [Dendrothele bispora CBS 962.96]|uniref:Uncharacterized protein n=1 Tax=Dendrothele bispora (strain CBS 962.96) TaxID=1314807 RepID=A0A4S8MIN1_DENBC|nr:hypothetical protein K435DRAFT_962909 [Dendrothele bispora CBS 962.96]
MSESSFPVTEAQLVAGYLGSVLYGFHTIAFGFGLHRTWDLSMSASSRGIVKLKERSWNTMNRLLLCAGVLLWILATLHIILFLRDSIQAFVFYQGPGGPAAAILERGWSGHVRSFVFLFETVIGDTVMIYRCFIVYGHSWPIVSPSLILLLAEFGCGLASFIIQVKTPPSIVLTDVGDTLRSVTLATWAITCALTTLNTFLIILRIWLVEKNSRAYITPTASRDNRLMYAIRIVMESGSLYAVVMLILLIVYSIGSNGAYPLTDSVPQVIGIAFNLIVVRSCSHSTSEHDGEEHGTQASSMSFTVPIGSMPLHHHRHISRSRTNASGSRHEERTSGTVTTWSSELDDEVDFQVLERGHERRQIDAGKIELQPVRSASLDRVNQ